MSKPVNTSKTGSARRRRRKASDTPSKPGRRIARLLLWAGAALIGVAGVLVLLFSTLNPPTTPYMMSERARLGEIAHDWVPMEEIAPVMARAAVAAEDANFCLHWGLDLKAIRTAMASGGNRGASTISQQVVKNVYLWQGRSWFRKALEAGMTPAVEAVWTKRRILEVYLNVAEFDEGVFGIGRAAPHYFGVAAADLTDVQAARLAAILPNPKGRSAANPSDFVRRRAAAILDGAATIRRDGRDDCFE
ncbi:monofunctional biosynthetic peptidoglycan transglycosylase [Limimaricola soesokkakensis]|uniref:Biosynthetic peptidoglycan transglycosylase n=1 Tax=Limimaricola soesokkakensis TaxID=1343159 RepID=A0A1X6YNN8_9RHOB|nr:monofunctional biosynthetic peptidoglycan transglycosylase [Limimaricola soesokkakensis]PSK88309.1 monofunctional biosynthetic peptidoglycan transglycosylase [Limimaricola soesokkakensis]SLN26943.1 Penicillin-binding protein 2D [Limimaricola soesokkakensis]